VTDELYEKPWHISSLGECDFYHTTEIPGVGVVKGQWDLRAGLDAYLGDFDFTGKRVLEIGPASGQLTYHIEKSAREVVAVDLPLDRGFWDFVPYERFGLNRDRVGAERGAVETSFYEAVTRVRNAFWYCHEKLNSKAKVHYGASDDLPDELGEFDVALLASVLLHTRSPAKILASCARRVTGSIIVTDLYYPEIGEGPVCSLVPTAENGMWDTWWRFSPAFFTQYLGVLGFPRHQVSFHKQKTTETIHELFTVVASRED
jgi:O-methyltransferase